MMKKDIIDILILQRKNGKYFGHLWDINKVYITDLKYFIIRDNKDIIYKKAIINTIIKRHQNINDFVVFSIKSPEINEYLRKFILTDLNNLIYNSNTMFNILHRRMQEDSQLERAWDRLDLPNFKTSKNYLGFIE